MKSNQEIVVHLVHGTFDPRKLGEPHWSDPDGMLANGIKARLPKDLRGRVNFVPFDWSGKNSFEERKSATVALTAILNRPDDRLRFFVGHSHGGTVIADALVAAVNPNVAGVMTLATPFVARTLDTSPGRLSIALFAPVLAFWIAFSGAMAFAIHQVWIGRTLSHNRPDRAARICRQSRGPLGVHLWVGGDSHHSAHFRCYCMLGFEPIE